MEPRKLFGSALLCRHDASTDYPPTWESFRKFQVRNSAEIAQQIRASWEKTSEMSLRVRVPFDKKMPLKLENRFADSLVREIQMYSAFLHEKKIVELEIGDGLLMNLSMKSVTKICEALFSCFSIRSSTVCRLEISPEFAVQKPKKLAAAFKMGFRGVRMRVPSERNETSSFYQLAVQNLRVQGFQQLVLDVVYDFQNQSDADLEKTIQCALSLEPEFITLLRNSENENYKESNIESNGASLYKSLHQYRLAYRLLTQQGFRANSGENTFFRLPEKGPSADFAASVTQSAVQGTPKLELGPGAQTFGIKYLSINYSERTDFGESERYAEALEDARFPIREFYALPREESIAKAVTTALSSGFVDYDAFEKQFGEKFIDCFAEETKFVQKSGFMREADGRLTFTQHGIDFVNGIIPLFYSPQIQEELVSQCEKKGEICAEEQEFLAGYNLEKYDRPSVTADVVAMTLRQEEKHENYRKNAAQHLSLLLIKRGGHPYINHWALPGGFLSKNETIEHCAQRELFEETALNTRALFPLGCFSAPNRDPRGWILSNAFLSIVGRDDNRLLYGDDAADARWFDLSYRLDGNLFEIDLQSEEIKIAAKLRVQSDFGVSRFEILSNGGAFRLAFDHALIIASALFQLRGEAGRTELSFAFLPDYFTLSELQNLHEKILNTRELPANFRRKMLPFLEKTDEILHEFGHRPAALFRKKETDRAN